MKHYLEVSGRLFNAQLEVRDGVVVDAPSFLAHHKGVGIRGVKSSLTMHGYGYREPEPEPGSEVESGVKSVAGCRSRSTEPIPEAGGC